MNYLSSKRVGDSAEMVVVGLLADCGLSHRYNREKNVDELRGWDVAVYGDEGLEAKTEIKHDLYEARSGNIAIEYFNTRKGVPSGIMATKADFWVVVLSDKSVWMASTEKLKIYFHKTTPHRIIESGGDNNSSMALYRRSLIFDGTPFARLDVMSADEVYGLFTKAGDR